MTPRQQRRLEQKLARKAEKKAAPNSNVPAEFPAPGNVSAAKMAANVSNAQLSTGPITEAGKAIVSQNATRHGLTGKFRVLPNESQDDFDQLLAAFLRAEAPADQEEVQMVQFMVEATWLSRRAVRLQDDAIIAIASGTPEERKEAHKHLALYLRYMSTHDRAYSRYAAELRKRRNERARQQRGFVSQKHREAAEARRQANENRKKELHQLRRETLILRQQRYALPRVAKADMLEPRKNMAAVA